MSSIDNLDAIISKVQKLRNLAARSNVIGEVEAATLAADRIMSEHRLTEEQLAGEVNDQTIVGVVAEVRGRRSDWKENILSALCKIYSCKFYLSFSKSRNDNGRVLSSVKYNTVGYENDLKIVGYMYSWITNEIERLGKFHCKGKGIPFALSWYGGASAGVSSKLLEASKANKIAQQEQAAQDVSKSAALARLDNRSNEVDKHLSNQFGKMKISKSLKGASDLGAYNAGFETGRNLSINKGLNGSSSANQLSK